MSGLSFLFLPLCMLGLPVLFWPLGMNRECAAQLGSITSQTSALLQLVSFCLSLSCSFAWCVYLVSWWASTRAGKERVVLHSLAMQRNRPAPLPPPFWPCPLAPLALGPWPCSPLPPAPPPYPPGPAPCPFWSWAPGPVSPAHPPSPRPCHSPKWPCIPNLLIIVCP